MTYFTYVRPLLFEILWTQSVSRKGKQNFALFSSHFVLLLLYFLAISTRFIILRTYLGANLPAVTDLSGTCLRASYTGKVEPALLEYSIFHY